jgi:PHD/YefM family antitoxin component YafN of YafNO toxin-antitoxin module
MLGGLRRIGHTALRSVVSVAPTCTHARGEAEAVLLSVDDLEGLEMTLEILGESDAVTRISESLAALGRVLEFCEAALAVNPHRLGSPSTG